MSNDMLEMFIFENVQLTERLEEVLIEGEQMGGFSEEHINEIFRIMHTIKGSAAMMEYDGIANLAHKIEDMFFYIREHDDADPDWGEIADICLGAVDFFKQEVVKIQAGKPSDGDMSATLSRIEKCMNTLTNPGGGADDDEYDDDDDDDEYEDKKDEEEEADEDEDNDPDETDDANENDSDKEELEEAMAGKGTEYQCRIFFEDGCKMENIRAYQISNTLMDYASAIESVPEDLLEDCSDEIILNGVLFTIHSERSADVLREVVSEALFVKRYELNPVTPGSAAAVAEPKAEVKAEVEPEMPQETPQPKKEEAKKPMEKQGKAAGEHKKKKAAPKDKPKAASPAPAEQSPAPSAPAPDVMPESLAPTEIKQSFISVNVDKLDKLMDLMGEIVISVSMVVNNPDLDGLELDSFEKSAAQLQKNTSELQDIIMSVRMLPISSTFHKMSRIVRDTSKKLGKEAELVILGEETEVDKNIIDNLSDPLMHIIRNSMDHGIEDSREERVDAGKPAVARIILEARNSGSDVIISCTDDGRGLDRDKILAKAKMNGLLSRHESDYTDKEIYQFIMLPGFSTNETVTELSGRGVGMDVVKKNIEKVGGTVDLESTIGQGMTVNIRIPLTLAILQCIEISVGKNNYLIPTLNIRESFKPSMEDIIIDPDGNEMIMFRGECFSIVRLHRLFGVETQVDEFEDGIMIMIEDDDRMTAVFADHLVGEQQAVVKPIPNFITERIGQIYGISGCTLLGDGSISLIIDVKSLTQ